MRRSIQGSQRTFHSLKIYFSAISPTSISSAMVTTAMTNCSDISASSRSLTIDQNLEFSVPFSLAIDESSLRNSVGVLFTVFAGSVRDVEEKECSENEDDEEAGDCQSCLEGGVGRGQSRSGGNEDDRGGCVVSRTVVGLGPACVKRQLAYA